MSAAALGNEPPGGGEWTLHQVLAGQVEGEPTRRCLSTSLVLKIRHPTGDVVRSSARLLVASLAAVLE